MAMIETNTSQLKAKLGQFMRAVRAGKQVVIKDRDRPVARLVPYKAEGKKAEALITKPKNPGAPSLSAVKVRPISYRGPSSTELLRSDREKR
ncbi:MAG: type II toxin-antitoxin system Phd/YefM family antitoxin [Myxococcota bacterium]